MRVGFGYDVHRLVEDRRLILGGVAIPFERGLLGHSDADVLLHALCDALLGAAGLGDIGKHFPDNDPQFKDISSTTLLVRVFQMIEERGLSVNNVDGTLICETPKLAAYLKTMEANIARALQIEPSRVNIKATTTEGLGATGRGEAVAAMCVVGLLES